MLFQRNPAILRNLFNFETSIDIDKTEKYDYTSTHDVFYLTRINQTICPLFTHDKKFDLFDNS